MKTLQLLINPIAGHGLAPRIAALLDASGLRSHYDVTIHFTQYPKHATELASAAVKNNCDVVVAVGGDGTVNEVASALVGSSTTLGIIPAGSGNGFARHIGMKTKPELALQQLTTAPVRKVDSLLINGMFSLNVSGFGFDGYVAWLFNKSGNRGLSNYTKIGLQEYFRYPIAKFELTIDGKKQLSDAHMLVIANASQFGNAAIIAPRSDIYDGKLDLVIVKRPNLFSLPVNFIRLFSGTLKDNKNIQTITCSTFTATSSRPLHLHIDGEGIDPLEKIEVKINPGSLNVLVPTKK